MEAEELETICEHATMEARSLIPASVSADVIVLVTARLGSGLNRSGVNFSIADTEDESVALKRATELLFTNLEAVLHAQGRSLQVFDMPHPPGQG